MTRAPLFPDGTRWRRIGRAALVLAKVVLPLLLIAALVRSVGAQQLLDAARDFSLPYAFVSLGLMAAGVAIAGVRWALVMTRLGYPVSLTDSIGLNFLSYFFGQVLPSPVTGDLYKVAKLKGLGIPVSVSLTGAILDRVVAVLGAVGVLACLGLAMPWFRADPRLLWLVLAGVAACAGGLGLLLALDRLIRPSGSWFARLAVLSGGARRLFRSPTAVMAVMLALAMQTVTGASLAAIAAGLGLECGIVNCAIVVALVNLVTILPISIGGWGAREVTIVVVLGLAGLRAEQAFALSLIWGCINTALALPGGLMWLRERPPGHARRFARSARPRR